MSLAEVYYLNSTVCSAISLRSVKKTISFMWGCGEESNSCQDHSTSATTQDWELKADLGKQLKYSGNNNLNAGHGADFRSLQAGGSHRGGQMRGKVDESLRNGWRAMCEPIEVGCREFAGRIHNRPGFPGISRRRAIKFATNATELASRCLWIRRGEPLVGHCYLDTSQGLTNPSWVSRVKVYDRLKTPNSQ